MGQALRLAELGRGRVEPNPLVGAVVVVDGRIVGEGHHARYGGEHAEVGALRAAGSLARGATAYVTLEPCGHQGKTPPCAEALVRAGVGRVVFAAKDPNPATSGKGPSYLREAGIVCSLREDTVRLSPHMYNTEEECERVLETAAGR